jgi:Ca2+-binding EF-hand superfamily protein
MIEEERIAEAFDRLDSDNTNHISRANLMTFLGRDANTVDVDGLLDEWDINKDGKSES